LEFDKHVGTDPEGKSHYTIGEFLPREGRITITLDISVHPAKVRM
jgi:hypothetical protein